MDIYVDKTALKEIVKEIQNSATTIREIMKSIEQNNTSLARYWQGSSQQNFDQKITQDYHETFTTFCERLEEYATYLENACLLYQKLEDTFKNKKVDV